MNWYLKTILSQQVLSPGVEGYLESLGTTPDIIQYILSLDKNQAQILINEVRKDPFLTLQELQGMQPVQSPEQMSQYLRRELNEASSYPEIKNWVLVNFRKIRKGKMLDAKDINNLDRSVIDKILTPEESELYFTFENKLEEI